MSRPEQTWCPTGRTRASDLHHGTPTPECLVGLGPVQGVPGAGNRQPARAPMRSSSERPACTGCATRTACTRCRAGRARARCPPGGAAQTGPRLGGDDLDVPDNGAVFGCDGVVQFLSLWASPTGHMRVVLCHATWPCSSCIVECAPSAIEVKARHPGRHGSRYRLAHQISGAEVSEHGRFRRKSARPTRQTD